MAVNNYLVFREEPLTDSQIPHRNEHNERMANTYANSNINLSLSGSNIYLKKPDASYQEIFHRKLSAGEITIKGLKADAAHFSEIIVAVNRDYWIGKSEEEIKRFFYAAYQHFSEKFGEENIISAVIHADEVSEGKINYHMHLVAIPTVKKKRYYSKRSRQYKALAEAIGEKNILPNDERLLKDTECQVSHSKFFESVRDEEHKRLLYSYSVWQDDLLAALKEAGFTDICRGSQNQKAQHLHPSAYKALMDRIEAEADRLREDIVVKRLDEDHFSIEKKSLNAIYDLQEQAAKEKAGYEFAVEALAEEQKKVYDRQNQVYQIALQQKEIAAKAVDFNKLQKQAQDLYEENTRLKAIVMWLQEKLYNICQSFARVIQLWNQLQTDDSVDASRTAGEINSEMKNAVEQFNNSVQTDLAKE